MRHAMQTTKTITMAHRVLFFPFSTHRKQFYESLEWSIEPVHHCGAIGESDDRSYRSVRKFRPWGDEKDMYEDRRWFECNSFDGAFWMRLKRTELTGKERKASLTLQRGMGKG